MPRSASSHSSIHVTGIFCLLLLAYHVIFREYFPLPSGHMGHDFAFVLPNLLDGYLWFRNNGFFTPPWFTPSFCGGQPFFADPQSIYYSLPQLLTFVTNPLQAVYLSFLTFAGLGFWGMYLFARKNLHLNCSTATVAAGVFMFNGFYSHRMIIGHYGYQSFMLVPLIAWLLLDRPEKRLRSLGGFGRSLAAGSLVAYCFQSGLTTLMVPAALAVISLACLTAITTPRHPATPFLQRSMLSGIFALALCASKLNANLSLMRNFPRDFYPLPGIADLGGLLTFVFQSLFYSSEHVYQTVTPQWKNMQWAAMPHELAFSLTPATLLTLLAGSMAYLLSGRINKSSETKRFNFTWLPLITIFLLPLALLYYSPEWNSILKNLPLVGSTTSPYRWIIIYIPPIAAVAGIATQFTGKYRLPLAALTLFSLPLLNELETRDYYQQQNYDPAPVVAYYGALAEGKIQPGIWAVADPHDSNNLPLIDNGLFLRGISPLRCYNPLYGYRLEKLVIEPLQAGPVDATTRQGSLNLHNPACQVFSIENHCQPGDAFPVTQKAALENFVNYRPYDFAKSTRQIVADLITGLSVMIGCIFIVIVIIKSAHTQKQD